MPTLTMCRGLSGSGKTTWAREQVAASGGKTKRVNRDDLRAMLDNGEWRPKNEQLVKSIRDRVIFMALVEGFNVINDDTNLSDADEKHMRGLADTAGANFEVSAQFMEVSVAECIKRDLARPHSVGAKVIRDQARRRWPIAPAIPDEYDYRLPNAVICDLDGTLALHNRSPYDYDSIPTDTLNRYVSNALHQMTRDGAMPIFVSGRPDSHREQTMRWLTSHGWVGMPLYMRLTGDDRPDTQVKQEIYNSYIKGRYNVMLVLDDRDRVVQMWRDLGLTVFQVAEGDF